MMPPDNAEVAHKLRELADLLDLGHAEVRSVSVTDTRQVVTALDGSHHMPRHRRDYLQISASVEGATEQHSRMEAEISWSFKP